MTVSEVNGVEMTWCRNDGLKLKIPEGWIHVRASNTEPLLRVAAEAKSENTVEKLYAEVLGLFATKAS